MVEKEQDLGHITGEQYDIINTVVHFLETHTAYDALPRSGKVSVFNSNMPICLAFDCLRSQEVAEAIIWNHEKNCFIGIFNSSDLIKAVLMQINMHRHHPDKVNDILLININTYREFQLKNESKQRLLDCQPTTSLIDILHIMSEYKIRRLPVIENNQVLGILTYSSILHHLVSSFDKSAAIYQQTIRELHLGMYKDVISCPASTSVAQALFILESRNISSILVTNEEGRMTTIFQRSDIFKLDIMDMDLLEKPLSAIPALSQKVPHVLCCKQDDNLQYVFDTFASTQLRLLVIVDDQDMPIGIISLVDLLNYFLSYIL
ncbi:hypothetical protein WA556_002021 [Blastocystis sp. ATCC 50177/Nand II]